MPTSRNSRDDYRKTPLEPDVDVQALIDDFINGYYGPAAPYVKQYVDELHARVAAPAVKLKLWTPMTSKIFSDEFLLRATELFEKAEEAVKNDPILLHNVQKAAMTVYYARFERLPSENIKYSWMTPRWFGKSHRAQKGTRRENPRKVHLRTQDPNRGKRNQARNSPPKLEKRIPRTRGVQNRKGRARCRRRADL